MALAMQEQGWAYEASGMSVPAANDENRQDLPASKLSTSETSVDIFACTQPTGRPSILRQSQADNLPSRSVPKGIKTPRRDPITKRIVSPANNLQMAVAQGLVDCSQDLDRALPEVNSSLVIKGTVLDIGEGCLSTPVDSLPDDNMPIYSKGTYELDFENLEAMNPFQGSSLLAASPPKTCESFQKHECAGDVELKEHSVDIDDQAVPAEQPSTYSGVQMSETLIKEESSLNETLPFVTTEGSLVDLSTEVCSTDSTVIIEVKCPAVEVQTDIFLTKELVPKESCKENFESQADDNLQTSAELQNSPAPPKGTYNFDFDSLDSINPFETGGSKLQNSPELGRKLPDSSFLPSTKDLLESEMPNEDLLMSRHVLPAPPSSQSVPEVGTSPPTRDVPMKLEFNFDDGNEVKRKPPPKKLGKRPSGVKPAIRKGLPAEGQPKPKVPVSPAANEHLSLDVPVAMASYNFDQLDDPFVSGSKMNSSPKLSEESSTSHQNAKLSLEIQETALPTKPETGQSEVETDPGVKQDLVIQTSDNSAESQPEENLVVPKEGGSTAFETTQQETPVPQSPALISDCGSTHSQPQCLSETGLVGVEEEFVPGATFLVDTFEGQIDYLEQFGSTTFKESALRKQSLYMKFDPLLRDSPKKMPPNTDPKLPLPVAFSSRLEAHKPESHVEKWHGLSFMEDVPAPAAEAAAALDTLVPPFSQPFGAEDAIIEVLRYSQKDMDAALEQAHKERDEALAQACAQAKEREEEWAAKYAKLRLDCLEMGKIMSDYEATISQITVDNEREKQALQEKLKREQHEKDQIALDLSAMERSCAELFKRLEKHKEVIEGYKKNEETLKKCAEDYLARIRKEEQRYQMLKTHAEEKISLANGEIAQLRTKHKAEASALQAQLRRELLKVQSLENSLVQKVKESEELTKLCDELIVNVQKR